MLNKININFLYGFIFLLLYCFFTAVSSVLVNQAEKSINPSLLTFYSFLFGALFFNSWGLMKSVSIFVLFKKHFSIVLKLNIATAIMWTAIFYALKCISPGIATAVFFGFLPIVTTILTIKRHGSDAIKIPEYIFSLTILVILVLLSLYYLSLQSFDLKSLLGVLLALVGSISIAYTNTYGHQLANYGYRATDVLATRFYLIIAIALFICWGSHLNLRLPGLGYIWAFLIAAVSVILPLFLLQRGLERIEPIYVSFILPFVPILTYVLQLATISYQFSMLQFLLLMLLTIVLLGFAITKIKAQRRISDAPKLAT